MKYTEKQVFMCSKNQKQTLQKLRSKYKVNTSQFIRDAINEKIERDKDSIFLSYKEFDEYFRKLNICPF